MYKKLQSFVALVLCLSCTFFTLSLNTLHVKAGSSTLNLNHSHTFSLYPDDKGDFFYVAGSPAAMLHSSNTYTYSGHLVWYDYVDFGLYSNYADTDYIALAYYNFSGSSTYGEVHNVQVFYNDICPYNQGFQKSYMAQYISGKLHLAPYCRFECDFTFARNYTANNMDAITFTVTTSGTYVASNVNESQLQTQAVNDHNANQKLDDLNETTEDTNETTHSIFDSITAFFSTFFSNLIGVFVPEDGYFTTWFNNLNSLLEAKLGILYYPFAKVIYFLNNLTTAFGGSASASFTFPAIEFTNQATGETYTFLSSQTVNLNDYNLPLSSSANSNLVGSTGYSSLIDIVRTFNGFVIVMLLLALLRQKLNLILRGDDNDS